MSTVDFLDEDPNFDETAKQNYVVMSFVSPEGIRNTKVRALKIRGVFETVEAAQAFANKLRDIDPRFHVYVGEIGKWLPWDPDPNSVKDQNYYEEELQKLMKSYHSSQEKAKVAEHERKNEMQTRAAVESKKVGDKGSEDPRDRLRRKLAERKAAKQQDQHADQQPTERFVSGQVDPATYNTTVPTSASLTDADVETSGSDADLTANLTKIKQLYANMSK